MLASEGGSAETASFLIDAFANAQNRAVPAKSWDYMYSTSKAFFQRELRGKMAAHSVNTRTGWSRSGA